MAQSEENNSVSFHSPESFDQNDTHIKHEDISAQNNATTDRNNKDALSPWQLILNSIVSQFWIGPLVVMYWVSTWNLVARELIYPEDVYISIWISAGIGFGIYFIGSISQRVLYRISKPKRKEAGQVLVSLLVSRGYTYVMAFASVNQWRSVWQGWDVYTSMTTNNAIVTFFGAYFILFLLRCSSQVLAPPSVVGMDAPLITYFDTSTYLRTPVCTWQHALDSLFTTTVVPFVFVTAWRGAWYILDRVFEHDDMVISGAYTLVFAYGLAVVLLLTRCLWRRLSIWSDNQFCLFKYLIEDTHSLLQSIAAIAHWRGFWVLYEQDFIDYPFNFWLGHFLSYGLLTLCLCSNSLVPKGCMLDGRETRGKGVELDFNYVTNLWGIWRRTQAGSKHVEGNQRKSVEAETLKRDDAARMSQNKPI